jgi:hypothetical protein
MNLTDHARQRKHWKDLTPQMQQRVESVLTAAEAPSVGVIAVDNQELRRQLGYTRRQWDRIATAMKSARFLDVQRKYSSDASGQMTDQRAATWIYCYDDSSRKSQVPRKRRTQDALKIRRLESQVGVLEDEVPASKVL